MVLSYLSNLPVKIYLVSSFQNLLESPFSQGNPSNSFPFSLWWLDIWFLPRTVHLWLLISFNLVSLSWFQLALFRIDIGFSLNSIFTFLYCIVTVCCHFSNVLVTPFPPKFLAVNLNVDCSYGLFNKALFSNPIFI